MDIALGAAALRGT